VGAGKNAEWPVAESLAFTLVSGRAVRESIINIFNRSFCNVAFRNLEAKKITLGPSEAMDSHVSVAATKREDLLLAHLSPGANKGFLIQPATQIVGL
jgi:hypothetical protein